MPANPTPNRARDIATRADIELLVRSFYAQVRSFYAPVRSFYAPVRSFYAPVRSFYAQVRDDELIGDLFSQSVGDDWAAHEARVCDFWETVLFGRARFKSRALLGHGDGDGICPLCPHHFQRWCDLFGRALEANFEGEGARRAYSRARAMSTALCHQLQRERRCPFASLSN